MKRYKRLYLLLGVLAVACIATFGVLRFEEHQEQIKNSDEIILKVPSDTVTSLSWEYQEESLSFHKEEVWLYDEDEAFPVSEEKINGLLAQFEEEMRCKSPGRFQATVRLLEEELETEIGVEGEVLAKLAEQLFAIRASIPAQGRIAYQFLPHEARNKTDETVRFLLGNIPEIRRCFERYVDAKCCMAELYSTDDRWFLEQKDKFEKEAGKILANRVLSGVKAICRLENENCGEAYLKNHREYLASRIIMEALGMLSRMAWKQEEGLAGGQMFQGDLSKEARKELFLKNQDKGYEH